MLLNTVISQTLAITTANSLVPSNSCCGTAGIKGTTPPTEVRQWINASRKHEANELFFLAGMSSLSTLQSFDTLGGTTGIQRFQPIQTIYASYH